jgi:hypothetical protein
MSLRAKEHLHMILLFFLIFLPQNHDDNTLEDRYTVVTDGTIFSCIMISDIYFTRTMFQTKEVTSVNNIRKKEIFF